MTDATPVDPRLTPFAQSVKNVSRPQDFYFGKAKDVRAERIEGIVHLYRRDDIMEVNRHPAVLGMGGRGGAFGNGMPLIPLEVDGLDHRKWRRLLDPMFAPKQVARLEASVRELAAELMDGFAASGRVELMAQFCVPLPCLTFLRLVGAPVEDLEFFIQFKDAILHTPGETPEEVQANMAAAGAELMGYFAGFIAQRRQEPERHGDIISDLIWSEVEGEPISDMDLLNIIFLFMFAGLDTVTASLSCIFAWLAQHPHERQRLVEDPALIPAAIEEILRFESPVPSGVRYATQDIDLGEGLVIENGEAIHAIWAAANVDPTVFVDPLTVNFDRGRVSHIVFASGVHRCLGSHLARLELRLAVEELLARIPDYSVAPDECLSFSNEAVRSLARLPIVFSPRPALAGSGSA